MRRFIILFLIGVILIPSLVSAQGIEIDKFNLENLGLKEDLGFEETSEISLDLEETINFFKEVKSLSSKVYNLVVKIWGMTNSFIENVTGLTLKEILIVLFKAVVGIVKTIVTLLNNVL